MKEKYLDKKYESMLWREVAVAPVSAISGVSEQDSNDIKNAFRIYTVRDLALNRYVLLAQEVNSFSKASGVIFDKTFNAKEYEELRKNP